MKMSFRIPQSQPPASWAFHEQKINFCYFKSPRFSDLTISAASVMLKVGNFPSRWYWGSNFIPIHFFLIFLLSTFSVICDQEIRLGCWEARTGNVCVWWAWCMRGALKDSIPSYFPYEIILTLSVWPSDPCQRVFVPVAISPCLQIPTSLHDGADEDHVASPFLA